MKSTVRATAALAALFALSLSPAARAADSLVEDLIGNLQTMRTVYRAEYAPASWKRKFTQYDLDTEFDKAVAAARANPNLTLAEAREILKGFIYAMRDYHTSISFVATESASLPFTVQGAGDRFFLAYIDRGKLSEAAFPFHVGDELVTFDGKPALQAVSEFQAEIAENVPATDRALAVLRLTARSAARGYRVPKGAITVGIRPKGETRVTETQLLWDYSPERIQPRGGLTGDTLLASPSLGLREERRPSLFRPRMSVDLADASAADNPYNLGTRKSFLPSLGAQVWTSPDDNAFHAYVFKTEDRRLAGYVRIPSYVPEGEDFKKALEDFAKIVGLFESVTDEMVIDQNNNPGGSVFYLYALASMLTDQPLKTPRHRMAINQGDVSDALEILARLQGVKSDEDARKLLRPEELDGYPASYEFARFTMAYAQFIVDEWNAGRKLTRPYWLIGADHINPAPVRYTKPILLLTNHLDFSGGDFFPTILQDNRRVTILGSRTAGAGGYVLDVKIQNNLGINSFRCTESLAERVDGNPIENLGVKPDIEYEITEADLTQNYAPYMKAIHAALAAIAK